MAEYCVACNAELKREKYRLRDKFGKPTQLGRVIKDLVEQDLCDITTIVVCSKCRYSLLHLEKLRKDYDTLKCKLKKQLADSHRVQPQSLQHAPAVRCRSPSAQTTGVSPAQKRPAIQRPITARKELFPLQDRVVRRTAMTVCGQTTESAPLPASQQQFCQTSVIRLTSSSISPMVVTPPRLLTGSPVSRIPIPNCIRDEENLAPVKVRDSKGRGRVSK